MFRTFSVLNHLLGTVLALAILTLVGLGGWLGYRSFHAERWAAEEAQRQLDEQNADITRLTDELQAGQAERARLQADLQEKLRQIERLQIDIQEKLRQIQRLQTALRLLKVDHRIARIQVLSQQGSAAAGDLLTKIGFAEVDAQGKPLGATRVFNIAGDVVYVDAWVIKFHDEHVEQGDPLRSTSICLFRRLFGEAQQPKDGFVLDAVGLRPAAYGLDETVSEPEKELWARFWEYANDPAVAKQAGVRAAHGEAPSIKLLPGKQYTILLRASGGLSIASEDSPTTPPTPPL